MPTYYPIRGEDVSIELLFNDTYYPVLCGTDCVFNRIPEFIYSTNPSSGLFKSKKIRREEWNMSVSGLTKAENDASLTFFYLLQNAVRRLTLSIRMTFTDPDGNSKSISGNVLIGNMSINGSSTDFANATIEFEGTGAFSTGATIDPPAAACSIYADYWLFPAGDTYIQGTSVVHGYSLEAVTVISVDREGVAYDLVSGTPSGRQCKHNNTTGIISFDANIPSNGETVWVVFI